MSTLGRPKGEYRSAQRGGCLMNTLGRPKGEYSLLEGRRAAPRVHQ
jgi:hypothetical protein